MTDANALPLIGGASTADALNDDGQRRFYITGRTIMLKRTLFAGAVAATLVAGAACSSSGGAGTPSSSAGTPAAAVTGPDIAPAAATALTGQAGAAPAQAGTQTVAKLNLNTATAEQLKTVPNVGDRFVREFMEYRPYTTIAQFRRELEKYASQDQVSQWEQYLYVPVDPNQSDADTLQQLPGVSAAIASRLIAARPYASTEAFVAKLGGLVAADQAAAARGYLATT